MREPAAATPRNPRDDALERLRWISMGAVLIGTFMVSLDQTIVTIALTQIGQELHALGDVDWVVTVYLLAAAVIQPTTGWLADRLGRKRVFLAGLAIFTIGSALSAASPSLPALVLARIVQGMGGGAIFPVGMAMVYEQFPPDRRGMALGIWGLGLTLAPAIGPALGGVIVTFLDWRWLFLINVPVGIIGVVVGARVLRLPGFHEARPFDRVGFFTVSVALAVILLALSEADTWGWIAAPTLALFVMGGSLLAVFAVHSLRVPDPLIDLRMFAIGPFTLTILIIAGLVIAQFARLVFLPLQLETLNGLSPIAVGLILAPAALVAGVTAPLAGRLADRVGSRRLVIVGLACNGFGALLLANVGADTSPVAVAGMVVLQGLGSGLALTPNTVAGMNSLPQQWLARGSAIRSTIRQVSASFGVAALTALVLAQAGGLTPTTATSATQLHTAYGSVFLASAALMGGCLLLALFLPDARRTRALQADRAVEHERLMADERGG